MSKYRYIISYIEKYKCSLIIGSIMILLLSLLIFPMPMLTRHILDVTLPNNNLIELVYLLVLVLGILLFQKIISFFQNILFFKINAKIIYDIKLDLLKKINKLPFEVVKKYGIGYLMSRVNADTDRLKTLFADTLVHIIKDVLTFVVGIIAIFYLNWKLALISISLLPFYLIGTFYFSKKIRNMSKIFYEDSANTNKRLEETLSMIELVKQFSRENFNLFRYLKKARIAFYSYILNSRKNVTIIE